MVPNVLPTCLNVFYTYNLYMIKSLYIGLPNTSLALLATTVLSLLVVRIITTTVLSLFVVRLITTTVLSLLVVRLITTTSLSSEYETIISRILQELFRISKRFLKDIINSLKSIVSLAFRFWFKVDHVFLLCQKSYDGLVNYLIFQWQLRPSTLFNRTNIHTITSVSRRVNIFIIYKVQDSIVLYNNASHPALWEGWHFTRTPTLFDLERSLGAIHVLYATFYWSYVPS